MNEIDQIEGNPNNRKILIIIGSLLGVLIICCCLVLGISTGIYLLSGQSLSETAKAGDLTVMYPDDWGKDRVGDAMLLASNRDILDDISILREEGALVIVGPVHWFSYNFDLDNDLEDIMDDFIDNQYQFEHLVVEEIKSTKIGSYDAITAPFTGEYYYSVDVEGILIIIETADQEYIVVTGFAAEGDFDKYASITNRIAKSVEYSP